MKAGFVQEFDGLLRARIVDGELEKEPLLEDPIRVDGSQPLD